METFPEEELFFIVAEKFLKRQYSWTQVTDDLLPVMQRGDFKSRDNLKRILRWIKHVQYPRKSYIDAIRNCAKTDPRVEVVLNWIATRRLMWLHRNSLDNSLNNATNSESAAQNHDVSESKHEVTQMTDPLREPNNNTPLNKEFSASKAKGDTTKTLPVSYRECLLGHGKVLLYEGETCCRRCCPHCNRAHLALGAIFDEKEEVTPAKMTVSGSEK
ncbi:hypothetical protein EJ08DRAFT_730932 [Tothia fuscella]|uniref:Uncharacterized protein n=1 Tax=Tothia fuscella TaxID=1048955 RepID=A0A9P4U1V9_9PEZI|nr:hypothetical protein EJ08DRAFT_730932 [Tothia fuscella]